MDDSLRPQNKRVEEILKKVRKIEISTRKVVDTILSGQYKTRFKGQGMHFSDFREYYAGDDIRHIDWKVTARTQTAHIRKFEEERDLTVYFLVDVSKSGDFGSKDKSKRDVLSEICALLTFAATRNNDRVGLVMFTDHVEKHIPARKGMAHAMRLVTELLSYQPQGKGTDLKGALDHYYKAVKNTSVVFLASDFHQEELLKPLRKVARRHDLIGIHVKDQREKELPYVGLVEFLDPETGEVFWGDLTSAAFRKQFQTRMESRTQELATEFKQAGIDVIEVDTHEDYFSKVVGYFKKARRL